MGNRVINGVSVAVSLLLIGIIKIYQLVLSPWLGRSCRFYPTCSEYTIQALREWGPLKGTWLGIKRIGRCNPWTSCAHGEDPVPPKNNPEHIHS